MKYPPVNTLYVPAGLRASYPSGYRVNGVIDSLGGGEAPVNAVTHLSIPVTHLGEYVTHT